MKLSSFLLSAALIGLSTAGLAVPVAADVVTKTVPLEDVQRVALDGSHDLTLIQGDEAYVKITGPRKVVSNMVAEVKGDRLRLRHKSAGRSWRISLFEFDGKAQFEVQLPEIHELEVSGSGDIVVSDINSDKLNLEFSGSPDVQVADVKVEKFSLEVAGSADIDVAAVKAVSTSIEVAGSPNVEIASLLNEGDLDIEVAGSADVIFGDLSAHSIDVEIAGSADVVVRGEGNADRQVIEIAGSGDYRAPNVQSRKVEVEMAGSPMAEVRVSDSLSVESMGSADVIYYGSPEINSDIDGSGEVRQGSSSH